MQQRSMNYFLGSLFSRQFLYAYAIGGAFTTGVQLMALWTGKFSSMPRKMESLPRFLELYIETLLPVWIPPITEYNVVLVVSNVVVAVILLLSWTISYDRSY